MPKKTFKKKKTYQAFCREQAAKGVLNMASGQWGGGSDKLVNANDSMYRDYFAGYKLNK